MNKYFLIIFVFFSQMVYLNAEEYKTVSPFSASYSAYYNGEKAGTVTRKLSHDGVHYNLESISSLNATYGFIPVSDKRVEDSLFKIDSKGNYKPITYSMIRTGTWIDFSMYINFDYDKNKVSFNYKNKKNTLDIGKNVLDNSIFQIKMQDLIKNGNRTDIKYDVAYKNGFRNFHFKYVSDEVLNINNEDKNTIKFMQVRNNKDGSKKAFYCWFDPSRDYVIVKFLYLNDDGDEEGLFNLERYIQG